MAWVKCLLKHAEGQNGTAGPLLGTPSSLLFKGWRRRSESNDSCSVYRGKMTFLPNGSSYLWHSSDYLVLSRLLKNSLKVRISLGSGGPSTGAPGSSSVPFADSETAAFGSNGNLFRIPENLLKPFAPSSRRRCGAIV